MKFKNKVVIVTGGSKGIGKEIVMGFAKEGAVVIFVYNNSLEEAESFVKEMEQKNLVVKAYKLDVKDTDSIIDFIESVVNKYGKIDVLVNNAGVTNDTFLMIMNDSQWMDVIETNLCGTFNFCRTVLPYMIGKREGAIINIASVASFVGISGQTNYCASKAGVVGLTKALSKEVSSKNIRVNAVAPGYIDTDMLRKVPENLRERFKTSIPCKRFGKAEEIAKVVLFLASEDASYIMGQTIIADGGLLS